MSRNTHHLVNTLSLCIIIIYQTRHRFNGPYHPIMGRDATIPELIDMLTPQQAMSDMIQLKKHSRRNWVVRSTVNCHQITAHLSQLVEVTLGFYPKCSGLCTKILWILAMLHRLCQNCMIRQQVKMYTMIL